MDLLQLFMAFVMLYFAVTVLKIIVDTGMIVFRYGNLFLLKRKTQKVKTQIRNLRFRAQRRAFYAENMRRPGNVVDAREIHHV